MTEVKPARTEAKEGRVVPAAAWSPFGSLRREVDRLFEDFDRGLWPRPLWPRELEASWAQGGWAMSPAVDIVEKEGAYEITAELPGLEEKDVDVKVADGNLVIKGEKQEQKEEKRKGYQLKERRYGAFERCFALPEGVDVEKIDATFRNGVLTVSLPKMPEAQKPEKKIAVKAA